MIDWKKELGKNSCYKNLYKGTTLDDVANCLSIIPEEIDTPVLIEIRKIVSDYGGHTTYPGNELVEVAEPIKLKHLVVGRPLPWRTDKLDPPEDVLSDVKGRIRWAMNDAPYDILRTCNQRFEWKDNKQTNRIVNADGMQPCSVLDDAIIKMRELGDMLSEENWDFKKMVSNIRELSHKTWISQNAWDLTKDELSKIDIDEKLGFKEEKNE